MRPIYWHRFPFLFLVIPLISGIIASRYLSCIPSPVILCFIVLSFISLFAVKKLRSGTPFVVLSFIGFFFSGIYLTETKTPSITSGNTYALEGRCDRIMSPGKIIVSNGQVNTYLQISNTVKVKVGDSLSCLARLYPLVISQNQHDFDYNNYLRHQGVDIRGIPVGDIRKTGHSRDVYSVCHATQEYLSAKLRRVVHDSTTYQLLSALCLGNRQEIPPGIKLLFQETGTIHLLAISGLHVGIIFGLFLYLLHLFKLRNRKLRLLLIPLIWMIAGITGLSPSACRAATILSFITIGEAFRQDYIPLNAIAAAAFFSLLVNPALLYSVSFQMSYAAYTGIVLILPLMRIKQIPGKLRFVYSLFCMSFAAQVMTLPITAYYFHSISLNSIFINIVAVPLASILLYGGIILLALPAFISTYLAFPVIMLTRVLINSLEIFSEIVINLPDLYPTSAHIVLLYSITALIVIYLITRERRTLKLLCSTVGLLVIFTCGYTYYRQTRQEIVICNAYKHSTILLNYEGFYSYLKNTNPSPRLSGYITANQLQELPEHEAFKSKQMQYSKNQLHSSPRSVSILDRNHPSLPSRGILIVTDNVFPPDSMISHPVQIITDNSNSSRCTRAWEEFCLRNQIPFHKTSELGTIVIPLK